MNSTIAPTKIIDFLDLSSSLKHQFDHLWHPTSLVTAHDDDDFIDYTNRPKYEVCAGNTCLVKCSTIGCGHDKSFHYSFVTVTKSRQLDEGDIKNFKRPQKPVDVYLQNNVVLKYGDWLMMFYIDPYGVILSMGQTVNGLNFATCLVTKVSSKRYMDQKVAECCKGFICLECVSFTS